MKVQKGGDSSSRSGEKLVWFGALAVSSVGLTVGNKALKMAYPYNNALMIIQNAMTVLCLIAGNFMGKIVFKPFTSRQVRIFFFSSVLLALQIVTALLALDHVAIATVAIFRNLSMLLVGIIDTVVFKTPMGPEKGAALMLVVAGSIIYAGFDANYSSVGYFWQTCNSVIYIVNTFYNKIYQTALQRGNEQTAEGNALVEQCWTLLWGGVFGYAAGEFAPGGAIHGLTTMSAATRTTLLATGFLALLISSAYNHVYELEAATTVAVAANVNKAIAIVMGAVLFQTIFVANQVLGLIICMLGGVWYSIASKKRGNSSTWAIVTFLGLSKEKTM